MKKKISIITIGYNNPTEIKITCDSIDNQCYKNIENIIVASGCSEMELKSLLAEKEGCFKKFIINKDDSLYNAMNLGINGASGEFIFFLNSGDVFNSKNSLQKCVKMMKEKKCYLFRTVQIWKKDAYIRPSLDNLDKLIKHPAHQGFFTPLQKEMPRFLEDGRINADSIWMSTCMKIYGVQVHSDIIARFFLGGISNYPTIHAVSIRTRTQGVACGLKEACKFFLRKIIGNNNYYRVSMKKAGNEKRAYKEINDVFLLS